ncbi:DNA primase [Candidatus Amesbacteria bacterium RIFCSPHIGHO2_01_FULL_48_32]|uniref:DNA primase n=1 Tax=Candidatus Amesbacteria bacterium RIFCSPLOWO2_01_FULL_48_25 TaxID=1797259 RepID=A0A1F4ZAZ0_9BACT|nr:MAG: DNA primase [Candidatus Amesbacteria bacterium RIFCSPHIGHO2_01_FULL_48_32]OGD03057.1 MAG: DNA primase [Candidatus Amesbacteria bacterium RIFCSPLOWO2_01_FULL_48_25]
MDQVEEIKQKIDIVELISEYVPLKRAGRNFKGLCPFHGEKTPSFMVNPELQIYKCFGCGEGGDAYSFVQKMEGMDFSEALKSLADRVGVKLESYRPSQGEEIKEKLIKVNTLAADAYHFLLTKHKAGKKALEYVKERGLSDEAIKRFKIGYAPDEWEFLSKFLVKKKGYVIDDLRRGGLIVEGRGYDRFRDRIMFPLANARGQIVGFAGRVLPPSSAEASEGQGGAKYVNTPETEIYHKSELLYGFDVTRGEIKKAGWVVVVEGELDMIASFQAGVKNVVAIKGSALTLGQVELLRRVCGEIVLALDADVAGDAAARRGIEIADKNGLMVKMVKLLGAKDPGELAIQNPGEWKKVVEEAIPVYDFYIESAVSRHGLSVVGKKKIGLELVPIWGKISDEIVKGHYVKKLAETLGVDEQAVWGEVSKIPDFAKALSDKQDEQTKKTRRDVVEEYVVGLALRVNRVNQLIGEPVNQFFKLPFWRKVLDQFSSFKPQIPVNELINKLPSELKEKVQMLMLVEDGLDEEKIDREWEKALGELEQLDVRERIGAGEGEDLARLTKRLAELTRGK